MGYSITKVSGGWVIAAPCHAWNLCYLSFLVVSCGALAGHRFSIHYWVRYSLHRRPSSKWIFFDWRSHLWHLEISHLVLWVLTSHDSIWLYFISNWVSVSKHTWSLKLYFSPVRARRSSCNINTHFSVLNWSSSGVISVLHFIIIGWTLFFILGLLLIWRLAWSWGLFWRRVGAIVTTSPYVLSQMSAAFFEAAATITVMKYRTRDKDFCEEASHW